jgi:hypothetical protein
MNNRIESLRNEMRSEINSLGSEIISLRSEMNNRINELDRKLDNRFLWLLGVQISTLVAIILTILLK